MTTVDSNHPPLRRPASLTLLAVLSNLAGLVTAMAAALRAQWESEVYLTPAEAAVAAVAVVCGIGMVAGSVGLLRLRSDARSLQMIVSVAWLAGWGAMALYEEQGSMVREMMFLMTPGGIVSVAMLLYLLRERTADLFRTAPPRRGGQALLVADAMMVLLIALVLYPALRQASARSPIKRTMSELRTIAMAVEAFATDHNTYPAAASFDDLVRQISPVYLRDVPKADAWKNGYRYESWSDNGGAANRYAVASGGKDRKFEHASLRDYQPRVSSDPAADLVYSNGDFVAYFESAPASPQIADGSEATFEKATMLYRSERFLDAIPLFEQFVRARPDHALAQARLGLSLSQVERYEDSVAVLKRANELDPADYQSRNNLALVYEKLGRAELGVAPAREAAALQPGEPLVQNTLGLVLMKAGHLPEAIEHLEAAARLQPKLVAAHYNLALAYTEAGRHDRAQRALATLRSLDATTAAQLEAELTDPDSSGGTTTDPR